MHGRPIGPGSKKVRQIPFWALLKKRRKIRET